MNLRETFEAAAADLDQIDALVAGLESLTELSPMPNEFHNVWRSLRNYGLSMRANIHQIACIKNFRQADELFYPGRQPVIPLGSYQITESFEDEH